MPASGVGLRAHNRRAVLVLPPSSTGRAGPYAASLRGDGHPAAREVIAELWEQGVTPDFREPDGVRLGMSPASNSFAEVAGAPAVGRRAGVRRPQLRWPGPVAPRGSGSSGREGRGHPRPLPRPDAGAGCPPARRGQATPRCRSPPPPCPGRVEQFLRPHPPHVAGQRVDRRHPALLCSDLTSGQPIGG